ncbi:MAG: RNA polymerase sigma factor RpoH [Halothiobacillaceae bacterium]
MSKTMSQSMNWPVVGDSLQQYLNEVRRIPLLDAEEERALARRYRFQEDLGAARALILSHLRFVVHIARSYQGYGLAMPDLIQEGNVGLMKAVKRFDPEQNVRLVSFAVHWIRSEIHEFILRNWRIVKVATTKAQRKLFFRMKGLRDRIGWMGRREAESIAEELGVPTREVLEMEARLYGQDVTFEASGDDEDENARLAPAQYLTDGRDTAVDSIEQDDEQRRLDLVGKALEALDGRSRTILQRRWLAEPKATLHELAAEHGVSAERIRQIESAALKRLRGMLPAPD